MYPVLEYMTLVVPDWETAAPIWEHLKIVLSDRDTNNIKGRFMYHRYETVFTFKKENNFNSFSTICNSHVV